MTYLNHLLPLGIAAQTLRSAHQCPASPGVITPSAKKWEICGAAEGRKVAAKPASAR